METRLGLEQPGEGEICEPEMAGGKCDEGAKASPRTHEAISWQPQTLNVTCNLGRRRTTEMSEPASMTVARERGPESGNAGSLHRIVGAAVPRIALMEFADQCNRTAGYDCVPETSRRGRMKFLRQYETQNGLCALCRQWFAPAAMTRDHITPRAKGGGTDWDNIQLACAPCNELKGDVTRCSNGLHERPGANA